MHVTRRGFLLTGSAMLLLPHPRRAEGAPDQEQEHQVDVDAPVLSEDPTAVPVHVSMSHPMEPDHHVRSIEVRLEQDPVPAKGTFLFTPANGRAEIAFQMRSGTGGRLEAVAECTRHGRFVGSRLIRVAAGGCTTAPDSLDRSQLGNPRIRLPHAIRPGQIVVVRTKVDHTSYTGLVLRDGQFVRERPEFYVKQMLVFFDDRKISEFQMTSAVSPNPLIRFPLRVSRSGILRVVFVNSEGRRWEASQPVRL